MLFGRTFVALRDLVSEEAWSVPLREEHAILASPAAARLAIPVAIVLALVVESPWGRRTTGVAPFWVLGMTALFVVAGYVVCFVLTYERYVGKAAYRAADALVTSAYCSVFGAVSTFDVSPGYAFVIPVALNHAIMRVHRKPPLLVAATFVPLALRFAAVEAPSSTSLLAALLIGVATSILTLVLGLRHDREHLLRLAFEEESARLKARRASVRSLLAAMSLHDGLSGAVLVLESMLADAARYDDVRTRVRAMVDRARAISAGTGSRSLDTLETELPTITAWLSSGCEVVVDRDAHTLPADERRDLGELAWEAAMNVVRIHRGATVLIRIAVTPDRVRLECATRGADTRAATKGSGRGLKYASMRAARRGGEFTLLPDGTYVAQWPRRPVPPAAGKTLAAWSLLGILAPSVLVAELTHHRSAIWLGVVGALSAASAYAAMGDDSAKLRRRLDALDAESLALDAQASLRRVRSLLEGPITLLAAADEARSLEDARIASRRLAEAVGLALGALEEDDALRAQVEPDVSGADRAASHGS